MYVCGCGLGVDSEVMTAQPLVKAQCLDVEAEAQQPVQYLLNIELRKELSVSSFL
jgi:hypothetical protein